MKKLLTVGLLLSLSIGSAQALRLRNPVAGQTPRIVPTHMQKSIGQLKDEFVVDKAKVAGLKAQARALTKPATQSPVVRRVLERKEAKLDVTQKAVKDAGQKLKSAKESLTKTATGLFK